MPEISGFEFEYVMNPDVGGDTREAFSAAKARQVHRFHRDIPGYTETPLAGLISLSSAWGVGGVFVKDESRRFGLNAFKALGGSYAVARLLCEKLDWDIAKTGFNRLRDPEVFAKIGRITLTTATDGNHGRGIAWAAATLGQQAVIFMPRNPAPARVEAIRAHGARVEVTDLNYDDAVRLACQTAEREGWEVVQDTAWEGYTKVPTWIMQGYLTMVHEAVERLDAYGIRPTHVFLQAGVGAMAGAVAGYLADRFGERAPTIVVVEPTNAACLYESMAAGDGKPHAVTGELKTIMAGLACGEPNPIGWDVLKATAQCFVRCGDFVAADGIRILANPIVGDPAVEAGESGSVGVGLLHLLANMPAFADLKAELGLTSRSVVLCFNTEGATDPVNYRDIAWFGKYPSKII
jgi:diaminopropionate ammonia-lyase